MDPKPAIRSYLCHSYRLTCGITQPLSLVATGYLAATYGVGIAFVAAGVVFLLAVGIGFSSRELRRV